MPCEYGRKIGVGHKVPRVALVLALRLLDWSAESDEGYESPCWIWQGHLDADGYGHIKYRGRNYRAARIAFAAFRGPLVAGTDVDHLCLCRGCINPAHLEQTSPSMNRVVRRNESMSNRETEVPF